MHVPKHFQQKERQTLLELIGNFPFATVVSLGEGVITADHLPLIIADEHADQLILQGHVARANPVWERIQGQSVLAIFHGPHAYVSPGAYPGKKVHGKVVPTWNYAVVHAAGPINFIHDSEWKFQFLDRLTHHSEKAEPEPWSMSEAPQEFIEKLSGAIVGFEIAVNRIEGKWKMSQNQPMENQAGVVAALETRTDTSSHAVARLIRGMQK